MPPRYEAASAGVVVYVHGLYQNVDQVWSEHQLGEQFAKSRRNALFIAIEAPVNPTDAPVWTSVSQVLATVFKALEMEKRRMPVGPLVVVGHSGAYRTIVTWLAEPLLGHITLVDGLYGNEDEYAAWLVSGPASSPAGDTEHRLTLVVETTHKWADPFIERFPFARRREDTPIRARAFTQDELTAKLLYMPSGHGHMELVTQGEVVPALLVQAGLPVVGRPIACNVPSPEAKSASTAVAKKDRGKRQRQESTAATAGPKERPGGRVARRPLRDGAPDSND